MISLDDANFIIALIKKRKIKYLINHENFK